MDQLAGPIGLALVAAMAFAGALIVTNLGLRHATPYRGATVSLTTSFVLLWAAAPALLDASAWHLGALGLFALVGLFYPAIVTLLTYESNRVHGPTLTGTVSSVAPLFAITAAVLVLGEELTVAVGVGGITIVAALVILSWHPKTATRLGGNLWLPLSSAALRGLAQALTKLGLALWPNPFAATLMCYTVSGVLIWGTAIARPPGQSLRSVARSVPWFMAAGALNSGALLLLNHALNQGRVGIVAPIVALYPLFTMLFSTLFLRTERLGRRMVVGALIAVVGVVILVSG